MSADYFAHAAYGVVLDDEEQDSLRAAVDLVREQAEESRDDFDDLSAADQLDVCLELLDENEGYIAELRKKYGAAKDARVIWTGDEDDRPGSCNIEADVFVLGYGLLHFPASDIPAEFIGRADWHSWVECSG